MNFTKYQITAYFATIFDKQAKGGLLWNVFPQNTGNTLVSVVSCKHITKKKHHDRCVAVSHLLFAVFKINTNEKGEANCVLLPETIVDDRCVYDVMTAEMTRRCRRP